MRNKLRTTFVISLFFSLISFSAFSVTFTSVTSGNWNNPATWGGSCTSGCVAGVDYPSSQTDVTISSGHTVTVPSLTNVGVKDLTIEAGATLDLKWNMYVYGNMTNDGSIPFSSVGKINFLNHNYIIAGTGTWNKGDWLVRGHRTITSGSVINKSLGNIIIYSGINLTNEGSVTFGGSITGNSATSTFINSAGASATFRNGVLATGVLVASAANNTITYGRTSSTQVIKAPQTTYYDLTISGGGTKVFAANTIVTNGITVNAANTLNTNNFDVSIGGDLTVNGTLLTTAGKTITFNGTTSAQTVTSADTLTVHNVLVNNSNGVNVASGTWLVMESLTATAGTFDAGANTVILNSDATSTARLGAIGATGNYSGNFIVQRYISARATNWADLASPVQNATVLDWDNEIYMSGVGGADGDVVDGSGNIWYSVYTYNEPTASYAAVTSTGTALTPGVGYELYLGDDQTSWAAKAITTQGTPTTGDQNINVSNSGDGWNLVGNPFASFIAWDNITMSGIDNSAYYIFDNATGSYATYGAGTEIPATQGFWVWANGAPSMTITESAKTTTTSSTFLKTAGNAWFTLKVSSMENPYSHKAHVRIGEGTTDFPFKKSRIKEAPSITFKDEKEWTIKAVDGSSESTSLPVEVKVGVDGVYTIEASELYLLEDYTCAILEDTRTGKKINLAEQSTYTFEARVDAETYFVLHLNKNGETCSDIRTAQSNDAEDVFVFSTSEGVFVQFTAGTDEVVTISANNVLGQSVMADTRVNTSEGRIRLNIPQGEQGVYFVNVQFGDKLVTKKIFMQKQ